MCANGRAVMQAPGKPSRAVPSCLIDPRGCACYHSCHPRRLPECRCPRGKTPDATTPPVQIGSWFRPGTPTPSTPARRACRPSKPRDRQPCLEGLGPPCWYDCVQQARIGASACRWRPTRVRSEGLGPRGMVDDLGAGRDGTHAARA
eukprot:scaffold16833_cov64-Phaeocystis_antarctica.AAC.4